MDWVVWLGANHSDALLHRADLQRRQVTQDAVSSSTERRTLHQRKGNVGDGLRLAMGHKLQPLTGERAN